MIRTLLFAATLAAAFGLGQCQAQTVDATIRFNWTFDYTGWPACSPTLTKGCIAGFRIYDATQPVHVLLFPGLTPNAPLPTGVASASFQISKPLAPGTYKAVVTAVFNDMTGWQTESLDSNEAVYSIVRRPPAPAGVGVIVVTVQ